MKYNFQEHKKHLEPTKMVFCRMRRTFATIMLSLVEQEIPMLLISEMCITTSSIIMSVLCSPTDR